MLFIIARIRRQETRKEEDDVQEEVNGSTTYGEGYGEDGEVCETHGEGGHDGEVEEVLIVFAFLDDVFVFEEGLDDVECGYGGGSETGDCNGDQV